MFIERVLAGSVGVLTAALVGLGCVEAVHRVAAAAYSWANAITAACNLGG